MQNSVSERVSRQESVISELRARNETNTISQDSINPSEDDTNLYPSSSVSPYPGKGVTVETGDVITTQPQKQSKAMHSAKSRIR